MLSAKNLKCEYLENPLGIGELKPRFSWVLESDESNIKQASYRIQVSDEDIGFNKPIWDSDIVATDQSIHIVYRGPALTSRTRYYFRVTIADNKGNGSPWSDISFFETGILHASEWKAEFISAENEQAAYSSAGTILRKTFTSGSNIVSARIYATSLGLYELSLNGSKVGDALLTPGWTSYRKRLQYQTYDVTSMLHSGRNAIGAVLGNGWFKGGLTWEDKRNIFGNRTALLLQLHIKYTDGSEQVIISDNSWKAGKGPILMSELYDGEIYDARLETDGWNAPEFDDSELPCAGEMQWDKNTLVAQQNEPVRKVCEIKPAALFTTPAGETVLDMGQNMVGWIRFKVSGEAGSKVILKHAEILDSRGNFYTENLRSAKQTVEYILKGTGEECFEPHFTFQGFRYVKLEQYPGKPEMSNFTGVVIHSGMEETGGFSCSNELVNQLQHNILWGLKGNFVDVPTDCPQRDERLGWTGDAQAFSRTACHIMNTAPFFKKWLGDLAADQLDNGGVPFVIPDVLENSHSSSGWGDAAVICPWNIYLCYGDARILENQYSSMKGWVEYIKSHSDGGLIWNSGFHFGDWLGLDAKEGSYVGATSTDLISTAFYAYSTELFAKSAEILYRENGCEAYKEDADQYWGLYKDIVLAFRKEFYTPSGRLAVPTQTGHVLALMFNLADDKARRRTVNDLIKLIEGSKWHLTTGFLGTPYLCHVLSSNGRADVAYKLLMQTDYPSWLYPVTQGATTIWEHWDGLKPDGSFWSADMNSFNHYAYGAIGEWLYRVVAGIDIDEKAPGYKHILIRPVPGGELTHANCSINSMYGRVSSSWRLNDGKMHIEVEIPCNTTAELTLPSSSLKELTDSKALDMSWPVSETEGGVAIILGSGKYSFTYMFK